MQQPREEPLGRARAAGAEPEGPRERKEAVESDEHAVRCRVPEGLVAVVDGRVQPEGARERDRLVGDARGGPRAQPEVGADVGEALEDEEDELGAKPPPAAHRGHPAHNRVEAETVLLIRALLFGSELAPSLVPRLVLRGQPEGHHQLRQRRQAWPGGVALLLLLRHLLAVGHARSAGGAHRRALPHRRRHPHERGGRAIGTLRQSERRGHDRTTGRRQPLR